MTEIRKSKQCLALEGFGHAQRLRCVLNIGICNLFGICDFRHKTPRQSHLSLTPAMRDRHGPSKIPLRGEGPGFSGQNKYWMGEHGDPRDQVAEWYDETPRPAGKSRVPKTGRSRDWRIYWRTRSRKGIASMPTPLPNTGLCIYRNAYLVPERKLGFFVQALLIKNLYISRHHNVRSEMHRQFPNILYAPWYSITLYFKQADLFVLFAGIIFHPVPSEPPWPKCVC